jgi:hypothetical protein
VSKSQQQAQHMGRESNSQADNGRSEFGKTDHGMLIVRCLRDRGSVPVVSMPRPFNRLKRDVEGEEAVEERRLAVSPGGQEAICWI